MNAGSNKCTSLPYVQSNSSYGSHLKDSLEWFHQMLCPENLLILGSSIVNNFAGWGWISIDEFANLTNSAFTYSLGAETLCSLNSKDSVHP